MDQRVSLIAFNNGKPLIGFDLTLFSSSHEVLTWWRVGAVKMIFYSTTFHLSISIYYSTALYKFSE